MRWRNKSGTAFYTDNQIIGDFRDYIKGLLTHKNKYNNLTYAEDPTIFAYESGNELDTNPSSWVKEIAVRTNPNHSFTFSNIALSQAHVKSLAPNKLFVDGTYGINKDHFTVAEIDIFSDHFYGPSVSKLQGDIASVEGANRVYFAGEYDWKGDLASFYQAIEAQQTKANPVITGDAFWRSEILLLSFLWLNLRGKANLAQALKLMLSSQPIRTQCA